MGTKVQEPIRVLHVFGRLDRGGAETMVMNLYRKIDRTSVQFDFILHTQEECSYNEEVRRLGGRIFSIPQYTAATAMRYRKMWRRFFDEHPEYRILHSHVRSTAALYLPIARRHHMITIIHSHNTSSGKGIRAAIKNIMQFPLRYQADVLLACGRSAGEWLYGKRACASERFHILPNAVELEKFRYVQAVRYRIRKELSCQDTELVIGHVGRFEEQKNHKFLLKVYAQIHRHRPDSRLLLIGEGLLEAEIRQWAKRLNLEESVYFMGNRNDVHKLMQAMDIFLFPSLFEGLPVTVVEAQASGLPVLMSDQITDEVMVTDLVHKLPLNSRNGTAGMEESWAEEAVELAGTKRQDRVVEMKEAGYDIDRSAQLIKDFYLDLSMHAKYGQEQG